MDAGLVKLVVVTFRVGAEGDGVGFRKFFFHFHPVVFFQLELDEDDAFFFVAVEGFLGELLSDEQLDGYDRAEVTRGGLSVDEIFPKTMECRKCPGMYFIGEALDVAGMLGGYNIHWAWASAQMLVNGLE